MTNRKMTAVQRIEINRFWNELEDVFDIMEKIKEDYDCDTIEEAENILNETVECDREVETAFSSFVGEETFCWCKGGESCARHEDDRVSGYGSGTESSGGTSSILQDCQDGYVSFQSPDHPQQQSPLPLPPSFHQTKPLLEMLHERQLLSHTWL